MLLLVNGDATRIPLEDGSVHCVVTSPPYWGLRKYEGVGGSDWPEVTYIPMAGLPSITIPPMRACLGLESTPEAYVGHLVLIWREVWRVMRDDAVCWLNLGDCYSQGGGKQVEQTKKASYGLVGMRQRTSGFDSKQLIGIPWRVALALQADGWYLRSDIIWAKGISYGEHTTTCPHCGKKHEARYSGSCMPESVKDRPTKGHEYLFLLAKGKKYYYDKWAIIETAGDGSDRWGGPTMNLDTGKSMGGNSVVGQAANRPGRTYTYTGGRNLRSVWTINPQSYKGAHYATFPEALVRPCILAGTSEAGVCPECGEPWRRVIEKGKRPIVGVDLPESKRMGDKGIVAAASGSVTSALRVSGGDKWVEWKANHPDVTADWFPACSCGNEEGMEWDDMDIILSPLAEKAGDDPSVITGRAGYNRPRHPDEGQRHITRYEQRQYAHQLRSSPHRIAMEADAGSVFEHYIRTDRAGARPIPDELLNKWIEQGWLEQVVIPEWSPPDPIPATILDPFAGSGTTLFVARELGRHAIGLDLSYSYLHDQASERLGLDKLREWHYGIDGSGDLSDLPLFKEEECQTT